MFQVYSKVIWLYIHTHTCIYFFRFFSTLHVLITEIEIEGIKNSQLTKTHLSEPRENKGDGTRGLWSVCVAVMLL